MRKPRKIKTLLRLCIKTIHAHHLRHGLCALTSYMRYNTEPKFFITEEEEAILDWYFKENAPLERWGTSGAYWFEPSLEAPRLRWLRKQIKQLNLI